METTTELEELKKGGRFTWGHILEWYEIGDYTIAKYEDKDDGISFYGWVGTKNVGHSWEALDLAIIGLMAYKYEGGNFRADRYFAKMLGLD